MAACAVGSPFFLYAEEYRRFARSLITTTLFVSSVQFRRESGYFDTEASSKPLLHTWSLSVEEIFYVVYPLASLFLWRWARDRRVRVLAMVALLSFFAYLVALYNDGHSRSAFYLAHLRAWELLVGALLALGAVRVPQRRMADSLSVVGVLMIGVAVIGYSGATTFPGLAAVLPCLGAALVILSGQHHPSLMGRLLSHRPIVFTGLIAYSLYLWHWPMLMFAYQWMGRRPSVLEGLGLAAASFVVAALSWRYIERPFRGKSGLFSRKSLFAVAAVVGALMVGIGIHGDVTKGWPGRYPAAYGVVLSADRDRDPRHEECISTAPDAGACTYGKQGATPMVALWGDSHAAIYAVMLGRLAGERDASLLAFTMQLARR
jgi:peptidoglycan/LPS O-acetylase OafA/YrhL